MNQSLYCILAFSIGLAALPTAAGIASLHGKDAKINRASRPTGKVQFSSGKVQFETFELQSSNFSSLECSGAPMSFETYMQKHKRAYTVGSKEYQERLALFEERSSEVRSHNCQSGRRLWTAGINHLSDRSEAELAQLRGYKGGHGAPGQPTSGGGEVARERLATLATSEASVGRRGRTESKDAHLTQMPTNFSWSHLKAMQDILDQGQCGSCWASASLKLLEAHSEIYATPQKFSLQQLVSCAPNPEDCGGKGGCDGSTGELALDYVMNNGLSADSEFGYSASDLACPHKMVARNPYPVPQPMAGSFLAVKTRSSEVSPSSPVAGSSPAHGFGMVGWNRLPVNQLGSLYSALYQEGPIAVTVAASSGWNMYESGIMDNCTDKTMVVNHMVVLIGYGEDDALQGKYWQLQNSWGKDWGEGGYIRMIRRDNEAEQKFCGVDDDPQLGTGCRGGPPQVWVCGSCGILYDTVIPHFHGEGPMAMTMMQRRTQKFGMPL